MQDIATKVEGSQLTAAEFNQIPSEIENTILSTGQSLSSADVRQLVKAIAIYAAKGDFYTATGTADALVLSPISLMQAPNAYYLGMRVRFIAVANNTANVTVAVGTLGTVSLLNNEGQEIGAGEIEAGREYSATYDGAAFRLFAAGLGAGAALPLFHHSFEDHLLTDASYLRADTFSWQDGTIYYTAYNELVAEKALAGDSYTETVAGIRITLYETPKGYKIIDDTQIDFANQIYNATGIAWYYILDEANSRFKLPRTKWGFTGLRTSVGNYVPESLPNIKGSLGYMSRGTNTANQGVSGVFYDTGAGSGYNASNSARSNIGFNASRSSSTYQDGAAVQQRATEMYLYFYVGNTKRRETDIDIGELTEALNNKLDLGMGNATTETKETVVRWGLPNYSAIITGISFPYTAPSDGLVLTSAVSPGSTYTACTMTVNGVEIQVMHGQWNQGGSGGRIPLWVMVRKGDVVNVANVIGSTADDKNFIPFYE